MAFGERFIGQLSGAVIASELFTVVDDLYRRVASDAADELQFGRVAVVEVQDRIFLLVFDIADTHRIPP